MDRIPQSDQAELFKLYPYYKRKHADKMVLEIIAENSANSADNRCVTIFTALCPGLLHYLIECMVSTHRSNSYELYHIYVAHIIEQMFPVKSGFSVLTLVMSTPIWEV